MTDVGKLVFLVVGHRSVSTRSAALVVMSVEVLSFVNMAQDVISVGHVVVPRSAHMATGGQLVENVKALVFVTITRLNGDANYVNAFELILRLLKFQRIDLSCNFNHEHTLERGIKTV